MSTESHIDNLLSNLPDLPGIYKMLDEENSVIYVGKAISLRKRVKSYFSKSVKNSKTIALVSHIKDIEVIVTHTEGEALILENNLIKEYKPRYNILFRDDKTYPYIYMSTDQAYPRLRFHRGAKRGKGRYYGPYPSAGAVKETLRLLQKVFPVRQCEDSFFNNRSRPCLQYQIKRCTAPCVGFVSEEAYKKDVRHVEMFLQGKSNVITDEWVLQMEKAAAEHEYEIAAMLRDQIGSLKLIQEKQYISSSGGNYDLVAVHIEKGAACVQLLMIRDGRMLGDKTYFPKITVDKDPASLINALLPQHYLRRDQQLANDLPDTIVLSEKIETAATLSELFTDIAGRKVRVTANVKGERRKWIEMAKNNAEVTLRARFNSQAAMVKRFEALQQELQLDECPKRLECFDISHTMGECTVASCVVFEQSGAVKSDYRRYNIEGITGGDDYAAMEQAMQRRYKKIIDNDGILPDILFVDGGKGQVTSAQQVMDELMIHDIAIIGVAKGPERKAGEETLILAGNLSENKLEINLASDSAALHLIQQIRDEAHRFAITGHRTRRGKARTHSVLEDIEGLGPKRRQILLKQFGGLQAVTKAGIDDLANVSGISKELATRIYDAFHADT